MDVVTAARLLAEGKTVAFPTETVYGLGADATNANGVGRIFAMKGRPANHPLIVHIAGTHGLRDWGSDVPNTALPLHQNLGFAKRCFS
ncbi:MAG TPA: Sua5/YciO/YrdC/YwlC family protein [Usitatibacter sp.]